MTDFMKIGNAMESNVNGIVAQYLAQPPDQRESWLEGQEWYQRLPDDRSVKCPHCNDTGTILDENNRARDCACRHGLPGSRKESNRYLVMHDTLAGRWPGWPVWEFEEHEKQPGFCQTKYHEAGKQFLKSLGSGHAGSLRLLGGHGRGKTYVSLQVLSGAAKSGLACMAFSWSEMIDWMKRGCQEDGFYQQKIDRRKAMIASLDVTLLDDIGNEGGINQDHSKVLLRAIVDTAIARKHSLLITSNLTPLAFAEYLDASTLSRLSGWGTEVYEPAGKPDFRL